MSELYQRAVFTIYFQCFIFEFDSNGGSAILLKFIHHELIEKLCFADICVANENYFEQIIVLVLVRNAGVYCVSFYFDDIFHRNLDCLQEMNMYVNLY